MKSEEKQQQEQRVEESQLSFESALERLESILERINGGEIGLEASIQLYEEADRLMKYCHGKLYQAEKKIEMLERNREGELLLNSERQPQTRPHG